MEGGEVEEGKLMGLMHVAFHCPFLFGYNLGACLI